MSQISAVRSPTFEVLFNVHKSANGGLDSITPKADFYAYMKAAREKQSESYLVNGNPSLKQVSDLSAAELNDWAKLFDPEDMTQDAYRAFVDKMIASGVLDERDKNYIGYSDMVCLGRLEDIHLSTGAYVTPFGEKSLAALADANGDALAWARHRAQWEPLVDMVTGRHNYAVERSAEAFKKIEAILEKIAGIRSERNLSA